MSAKWATKSATSAALSVSQETAVPSASTRLTAGRSLALAVVRVSCLSRVHSGLMLKALQLGADGVMLLGCEPDNCHFDIGAQCIAQEYAKAQQVLELLGLGGGRLLLAQKPPGDGPGFVGGVTSFAQEIERSITERV